MLTRLLRCPRLRRLRLRRIKPPRAAKPPALSVEKALDELMQTLDALSHERSADDKIWASMIKQAIKRRNPGFNERAARLSFVQRAGARSRKTRLARPGSRPEERRLCGAAGGVIQDWAASVRPGETCI